MDSQMVLDPYKLRRIIMNIRKFFNFDEKYSKFNREERNLAAIFYHLLLIEDNLKTFIGKVEGSPGINKEELGIYYEYAYLRDFWYQNKSNEEKQKFICDFLNLPNKQILEKMNVEEFNIYFGAGSKKAIENPGNWSLKKLAKSINNKEDYYKVCMFKWSFKVKPDIVIQLSRDEVICIECKFETKGETKYSTNDEALGKVSQTDVQKYMMDELIGFKAHYVLIVNGKRTKSNTHQVMLWSEAIKGLKLNPNNDSKMDKHNEFFQGWFDRLVK